MNLERRKRPQFGTAAAQALVGGWVSAEPPTVGRRISGMITEISGYTVSIQVLPGCWIAVDIEDCEWTATERT